MLGTAPSLPCSLLPHPSPGSLEPGWSRNSLRAFEGRPEDAAGAPRRRLRAAPAVAGAQPRRVPLFSARSGKTVRRARLAPTPVRPAWPGAPGGDRCRGRQHLFNWGKHNDSGCPIGMCVHLCVCVVCTRLRRHEMRGRRLALGSDCLEYDTNSDPSFCLPQLLLFFAFSLSYP